MRSGGLGVVGEGLGDEVSLLLEPFIDLIDQLGECGAAVIAGESFVHSPPDSFDGVCLRGITHRNSGKPLNWDAVEGEQAFVSGLT